MVLLECEVHKQYRSIERKIKQVSEWTGRLPRVILNNRPNKKRSLGIIQRRWTEQLNIVIK